MVYDLRFGSNLPFMRKILALRPNADIPFVYMGDALMFQCVFEAHRLYVYRKIALEIAALLPEGVRGRLLCLDKDFTSMHVFWLRSGQWQEEERPIPVAPPEGLKVWHIANPDMPEEDPAQSPET